MEDRLLQLKTTMAAAAVAATLCAAPASAQKLDTAPPQPDLTRQQAVQRADALFERFDLNHDGLVTRDEAQRVGKKLMLKRAATGRDPAPGLGGHTLRFLERRFAGVDGVTKQQFEEAMLAHFDEMDTDHDGVLTAAERQGRSPDASPR